MEYARVIISATTADEAENILNLLLEQRLIAGGLITRGLSHHWFEQTVEKKMYYSISAFTKLTHKDIIIEKVEYVHSDDVPIIAFFKIEHANQKFLNWIDTNVK